jgi:hypothetical protein
MKLSGMAGSLSADAAARRASSVSQGGVDPVAHAALTKQVGVSLRVEGWMGSLPSREGHHHPVEAGRWFGRACITQD